MTAAPDAIALRPWSSATSCGSANGGTCPRSRSTCTPTTRSRRRSTRSGSAARSMIRSRRYWIIELEGPPVGLANLYDISVLHRRAYWAFYLASPEVRGRGVGSFAERFVIRHAFEELRLRQAVLRGARDERRGRHDAPALRVPGRRHASRPRAQGRRAGRCRDAEPASRGVAGGPLVRRWLRCPRPAIARRSSRLFTRDDVAEFARLSGMTTRSTSTPRRRPPPGLTGRSSTARW